MTTKATAVDEDVAATPPATTDDELAAQFEALSPAERAALKAEHDEFAQAAAHFNHPVDVYLLQLRQWKDHVTEEVATAERKFAEFPAPTADEAASLTEIREQLQHAHDAARELLYLVECLEAAFETMQQVKTSAHVAVVVRYTITTEFFAERLLRNPDYVRVRHFAQWVVQSAKNLAYVTLKTEVADALPEAPEADGGDEEDAKTHVTK